MALTLYDHVSPVNFAYKGELSAAQIKADPTLAPMLERETVLYTDGEGTVYDFRYLDVLVGMYGNVGEDGTNDIPTDDPQAALDEVWRRMNEPKITQADIETMVDDLGEAAAESSATSDDLQAQIDLQGQAIEELIVQTLGE